MSKKDIPIWSGGVVGSANIEIGKIQQDNVGFFLPIHYNLPYGDESSIDQESALVRPFKKLLRDGKPVGKISYLFFQEKEINFVLGSLANTGNRLIFFPGIIPKKLVESPADQDFLRNHLAHVDHLSLEENWRNWHISLLEKETQGYRLKNKNTKKVSENLFLWFVMAVRTVDKLEKMPKKQEIRMYWPHFSELNRRVKEIIKSREGSIFHITKLDEHVEEEHYLNFEFFLHKSSQLNKGPIHPTVFTAKHVSDTNIEFIHHTREHPIILHNFKGLLSVRVSKVRGHLNDEGVFIPGNDYK
jgi:hypothetical protein